MLTSIKLLKDKLKVKLKGNVQSFYIGDPYIIPESALPCIAIDPEKTDTNILDNQRDAHVHSINISLIIDAKQYFNATPEKMVGIEFLMNIMEGEDSSGNIDASTVLGILRDNLNLDSNRYIQNISSIDYTVRRRTEDLITLEAIAHLEIIYIIQR